MDNKNNYYNEFEIVVNSKRRIISAIKKDSLIFKLQKKLVNNFLDYVPLPDYVCGFVKGKNYLDFLVPHCSKQFFLRIDIKDFFGSLKTELVRETFFEYINVRKEKEKKKILDEIIFITTYNGSVPQGAITSPILSNILFRRIDIRIKKYCEKFDVEYTRYADDLLFSSNKPEINKHFFIGTLKDILRDINLKINPKKIIKSENSIVLNGYVISKKISLSRKKLKKLNSYLYAFEYENGFKKYPTNFNEFISRLNNINPDIVNLTQDNIILKGNTLNYLAGYRAYLLSFNEQSIKEFTCDFSRKIKRIEKMLVNLSEIR